MRRKHRPKTSVVSMDRAGRVNHTQDVLAYGQYQLTK